MCKVLQEAIQVQQEWSSMHSIFNATPKQGLCVCVEREREKVVLALECAIECLFISDLFRTMLRCIRAQSDCRTLNFAVCPARVDL